MAKQPKRGRPPLLTTAAGWVTGPDGKRKKITTGDKIVAALRTGAYIEEAAAAAGLTKQTVYQWQRIGTKAARTVLEHGADMNTLTDHERACWAFADAVAQARADWLLEAHQLLDAEARGGRILRTVTEKTAPVVDPDTGEQTGTVLLERTVKEEEQGPNWQVTKWRLTVADRKRYGPRVAAEVSGPDGDPIELHITGDEATQELVESLRAFKEGRELEAFQLGADAARQLVEDEEEATADD